MAEEPKCILDKLLENTSHLVRECMTLILLLSALVFWKAMKNFTKHYHWLRLQFSFSGRVWLKTFMSFPRHPKDQMMPRISEINAAWNWKDWILVQQGLGDPYNAITKDGISHWARIYGFKGPKTSGTNMFGLAKYMRSSFAKILGGTETKWSFWLAKALRLLRVQMRPKKGQNLYFLSTWRRIEPLIIMTR